MIKFLILILTLFLPLTSQATAQSTKDYKYCNSHKFTYYLLKVYDISLCNNQSPSLDYQTLYNQDFSLIIKYHISIKGKKFTESSMEEISRYYKLSDETKKDYQKQLLNIFVNVKEEDEIVAVYKASGIIVFYLNQRGIGRITDGNFSKIFLDIWLHPDAHYANMRSDLLKIPQKS